MILLYHNLVPDNSMHGFANQGLTLFESDFRRQIKCLNKVYEILSLEEYLYYLGMNGKPKKNTIAITFDDGTYLTYKSLNIILKEFNISATIFITTSQIDDGPLIYGAHLNALCYEKIYDQIELDGVEYSLSNLDNQIKSKAQIIKIVKDREYDQDLLSELYERYPIPKQIKYYYKGMTSDQIIEAANSSIVSIGSHSVNHFELENLSLEKQKSEIFFSKEILENITNNEIKIFAYPSGSYNIDTLNLVKEAGYNNALAVKPKSRSNYSLYEIPRTGIYSKSLSKLFSKLIFRL